MTGINRQPVGLSNLLRVQAGGRNPDDFLQSLRGTIDVLPFYMPDRLRAERETFSLSVGQQEFIEVPEAQAWLVLGMAVEEESTTTGHSINLSTWLERIPGQGLNGVPWVKYNNEENKQTNAGNQVFAIELAVPRMVTAGQRITLKVDNTDLATLTGTFFVTFVLFDV